MPSHTPDGRLWYSIEEARGAVGVSRRTIYNWLASGKIVTRKSAGGATRILAESLIPDATEAPLRQEMA